MLEDSTAFLKQKYVEKLFTLTAVKNLLVIFLTSGVF